MGKSKLVSYLTLLMFICTWVAINLGFPAISLALSPDHKFRVENKNGYSYVIFYHPENEEHEHGYINDSEHHTFKFSSNGHPFHEHDFQLTSSDDQMLNPNNIVLNIDSEKTPALILNTEVFNLIPQTHSPYKYYKYPSGVNTTSLSLKTIVLLI